MEQTVLISMPVSDLQSLIISCVSNCLQNAPTPDSKLTEKPIGLDEAASFLNYDSATIYSLVQKDAIPFHKPARKIYFFKSELIEWIKSSKIHN